MEGGLPHGGRGNAHVYWHGLTLAEGINFDREGTLYCVDVYGGGIWRMLPGGALREWVNLDGP